MVKENILNKYIKVIEQEFENSYGEGVLYKKGLEKSINIERNNVQFLFDKLRSTGDYYIEQGRGGEGIYMDLERRDERLLPTIPEKERGFIEKWRMEKKLYPGMSGIQIDKFNVIRKNTIYLKLIRFQIKHRERSVFNFLF